MPSGRHLGGSSDVYGLQAPSREPPEFSGDTEEPVHSSGPDTLPDDREALEGWAAAGDVLWLLDVPTSRFLDEAPAALRDNLAAIARRWPTLGDLATLDVSEGRRAVFGKSDQVLGPEREAVRKAARKSLWDAARARMRARGEAEGLLSRPAPHHPVLAAVHASLSSRYRLLSLQLPVPLLVDRPWEGIVITDEGKLKVPVHRDGLILLSVTVDASNAERGEIGFECQACELLGPSVSTGAVEEVPCGADEVLFGPATESGCSHVLLVTSRLLDLVTHEPVESRRHEQILESLSTPSWKRLLSGLADVLDREEEAGEPAGEAARIAWSIDCSSVEGPTIEPLLQRLRKGGGGYTRGRRVQWKAFLEEQAAHSRAADRRLAVRLASISRMSSLCADAIVRDQVGYAWAARELAGHPLIFADGDPARPVRVRLGHAELAFEECEAGQYAAHLVSDGHVSTIEQVLAQVRLEGRVSSRPSGPGESVHVLIGQPDEGEVVVAELSTSALAVIEVLGRHGAKIPAEAAGGLLDHMGALERVLPVRLAKDLKGLSHPTDPRPVVYVSVDEGAAFRLRVRVQPAPSGGLFRPGEGGTEAVGRVKDTRVHVRRSLEVERDAAAALLTHLAVEQDDQQPSDSATRVTQEVLKAGGLVEEEPSLYRIERLDDALTVLSRLRSLVSDGKARVVWEKEEIRVTRPAMPVHLRVKVSRGRDLFGLTGKVEVDGVVVPLSAALDAVRSGRRFVEVDGRGFVALGARLRRQLSLTADLAKEGSGGTLVPASTAWMLEDLASDADSFDAPRAFDDLLARVKAAREEDPALPEGLECDLRPYQIEGYRWLARLASLGAGGVLGDDMGLGKTVQTIALLLARAERGPAMVVAPTSVCTSWSREAVRFAPSLRTHLYREHGVGERQSLLERLGAGDVLIVSYGLLARDHETLSSWRFATLVLDEAQAVKNAATRRARAARDVEADVRIALSGTPIENHVGELWSILRVVFPPLLGSWERFRETFARPIETGDEEISGTRRQQLANLVRPFILRRTKEKVATELPPRTDVTAPVRLGSGERALYEGIRLQALETLSGKTDAEDAKSDEGSEVSNEPVSAQRSPPLEGNRPADGIVEEPASRGGVVGPDDRFAILAALTRLRLASCHPRLLDQSSTISSSKLERFLEIVDELREEGHRALVFSQFTGHLSLVREALEERAITHLYLDGSTPPSSRDELVDRFQNGEGEIFLISLKAGGTGLTLTGADYVIHLDPWWNPAVEDQASDRAHRIGQTRPVTVIRLVTEETIEERVLALHEEKRRLVADVLGGTGETARLSTEDLLDLLKGASTLPSD